MGLRGITGYYKRYQSWTRGDIIKQQYRLSGSGGSILVDSWHVLKFMLCSETGHSYGGDYPEIALKARQLVEKLRRCNLKPIFVFSGLDSHHFAVEFVKAWPLLIIPVLLDVLRSLNVTIIQVDRQTIKTTAMLANSLECPVLSTRSEFLGCRVDEGVALFLKAEDVMNIWTDDSDALTVTLFWDCRQFMETAGMTSDDFSIFSAIATYCYTDHGPPRNGEIWCQQIFEDIIYGKRFTFENQVEYVFGKHRLGDDANIDELRERVESYNDDDDLDAYLFSNECRMLTYRKQELPTRYQQCWRARKLPPYLMSILCTRRVALPWILEDLNERSAFECSRPLRETSYAILLEYEFDDESPKETTRVGREMVDVEIPVLSRMPFFPYGALPRLEDIPTIAKRNRRDILLGVLGLVDVVGRRALDVQFLLSVTSYWSRQTTVSREHVRALLACLVKYKPLPDDDQPIDQGDELFTSRLSLKPRPMSEEKKLRILHTFSEWQTVFLDAWQLNQLLLSPFGEPSPSFFKGSFLVSAVDMIREGDEFDVEIREEFGQQKYQLLNQLCEFVQQHPGL